MIWQPKPGQTVRIHYAKDKAPHMQFHGESGVVHKTAIGPGPINALVLVELIEDRHREVRPLYPVIVPRGNLIYA